MEFLNYFSNVFTFANILILILGTVGGLLMGAAFAMPCSHYGEKIEAGVVLKKEKFLKEYDLIMHCKQFLGDFKSPSKIHFFDELPKGSSGKIQRFKIKDLINNNFK